MLPFKIAVGGNVLQVVMSLPDGTVVEPATKMSVVGVVSSVRVNTVVRIRSGQESNHCAYSGWTKSAIVSMVALLLFKTHCTHVR